MLLCTPTFFILAGSVNNDMLSVLFSLTALMLAVKWYKNPTMSGILRLALAIGLGMMTKLSVAMVAPAVAVLFAVKFFQSRFSAALSHNFPRLRRSRSLGLWWGVRNLIKSGVPITYVPVISKKSLSTSPNTRMETHIRYTHRGCVDGARRTVRIHSL